LEEIRGKINGVLAGPVKMQKRFHYIMYSLLHCQEGERFRNSDLVDEFTVNRKTIKRDMEFFVKHRLIEPNVQTGYRPQPKFFRLWNRLEKLDPEKYRFDVPYEEIYPEPDSEPAL
jgi:hypothetical protein